VVQNKCWKLLGRGCTSTCTCFYTRGSKVPKVWSVYCSSDLDEGFFKEFPRKILFRKMHWVITVLSWKGPKLKEIKILMFFIFHPILMLLFFVKWSSLLVIYQTLKEISSFILNRDLKFCILEIFIFHPILVHTCIFS